MDRTMLRNRGAVLLLTLCLGAVTGLVIWLFLLAVSAGTRLIWDILPQRAGLGWLIVPLCALGGLAMGLLRRRFGDYPEDLATVMGKVRREKHYDYRPMAVILLCALLPLIFGASVGPEAGLTGIVTALCYWVGDNVTYAKRNAALYSELGKAVALGQIFHAPLFGILAVEEEPGEKSDPPALPKPWKLVLYGLSTSAGFGVISLLNHLFHRSTEGFPSFPSVAIHPADYAALLLYLPVGILLYILFRAAEAGTEQAARHVPPILRETLCGTGIGLVGVFVPAALFSGEEEMAALIQNGGPAPWRLIGLCLLKLGLTSFCLSFGMKGGHFFPLIFACTCMGMALAGLVFPETAEHAAFAAGTVTAAALGSQMRKPLAVSALLLLCFPARLLFWMFLAAALGGRIAQLLERRDQRPTMPADAVLEEHTMRSL